MTIKAVPTKIRHTRFSLPLATWLSAGVSSINGNVRGELSASKALKIQPLVMVYPYQPFYIDKDGTGQRFLC